MVKKFYFKDVTTSRNRTYGYNVQELSVYYLEKDGQPILIDRFKYQTGSTPGPQQEILNHLTSHTYSKGYLIPNKYHGKKYYEDGIYKKYKIFEMF